MRPSTRTSRRLEPSSAAMDLPQNIGNKPQKRPFSDGRAHRVTTPFSAGQKGALEATIGS